MRLRFKKKKKEYKVGEVTITDNGIISLEDNEQITFVHNKDQQYDVSKTSWGFYATPSINVRLKKYKFCTFIVMNKLKKIFIHIVDKKEIKNHKKYLKSESMVIIEWPKNIKKFL
jgi:hypothetical protein